MCPGCWLIQTCLFYSESFSLIFDEIGFSSRVFIVFKICYCLHCNLFRYPVIECYFPMLIKQIYLFMESFNLNYEIGSYLKILIVLKIFFRSHFKWFSISDKLSQFNSPFKIYTMVSGNQLHWSPIKHCFEHFLRNCFFLQSSHRFWNLSCQE